MATGSLFERLLDLLNDSSISSGQWMEARAGPYGNGESVTCRLD